MGCLLCVICNSNSIHSLIFKLCIMIVHTLKMCTLYFVQIFHFFLSFLMGVELKTFFMSFSLSARNILGVPRKFSFLFIQTLPKDCSHIEVVHLLFCARFITFFLFFRGVELRHFFHPKCLGDA